MQHHKDGSVWAKGKMLTGQQVGYWEWFRKDGSKLRSGTFENGKQVGEWTTYDRNGAVYKVTTFKPRRHAPRKAENRANCMPKTYSLAWLRLPGIDARHSRSLTQARMCWATPTRSPFWLTILISLRERRLTGSTSVMV